MDMETTTATDTTHLNDIAAAITPEWVAELDDHDLARAVDDSPGSGLHVEMHGDTLRQIPDNGCSFGEYAVVWILDDGTAAIWSGIDYSDPTNVDGRWVYGDTVLIDPAIVAAALEAAA